MSHPFIIFCLLAYFIGSLPFAVIIGRLKHVDVCSKGSGNPGATNVHRLIGRKWGVLIFVLDAIKGGISASLPILFLSSWPEWLPLATFICAIIGHSFSVFLRFRGGKGVSTTIGGLALLLPQSLFIGLFVWLCVFYATRYVSLASLSFAITLPLTCLIITCSLDQPINIISVVIDKKKKDKAQ